MERQGTTFAKAIGMAEDQYGLIEKNKILLSEEVFDYYKPIIKSYLKINKSVDPYNLAKTPLQKKIIDLFFLENQTEISKSRYYK